jgi:hypothetical protein
VSVKDFRLNECIKFTVLRRILNVNTAEVLIPYCLSYCHTSKAIPITAPSLPQTRENCFINGIAISAERSTGQVSPIKGKRVDRGVSLNVKPLIGK